MGSQVGKNTNLVKPRESWNPSCVEHILLSTEEGEDLSIDLYTFTQVSRYLRDYSPARPADPHTLDLDLFRPLSSLLLGSIPVHHRLLLCPLSPLSTSSSILRIDLQPAHKPFLNLLAPTQLVVSNNEQRTALLPWFGRRRNEGRRCRRESTDDSTAETAVMFAIGDVEGGSARTRARQKSERWMGGWSATPDVRAYRTFLDRRVFFPPDDSLLSDWNSRESISLAQ
jgi:hypothetical protein